LNKTSQQDNYRDTWWGPANIASADNNVGGIDLTSERLRLDLEGEGIDLMSEALDPLHNIDSETIDGVTPLIFKMDLISDFSQIIVQF